MKLQERSLLLFWMSKTIRKIQAFTLSEMLVVLLLTSVVVGMAFSVLGLVQRQMQGITGNYERNTELNLLQQSLWVDFNQFDGIWFDALKEELMFVNGIKEIEYRFEDGYVVKDRDTFFIKIEKKSTYFNGENRVNGEIDAMDLYTSKEEGGQRVFVFKKNSATSYLNQ